MNVLEFPSSFSAKCKTVLAHHDKHLFTTVLLNSFDYFPRKSSEEGKSCVTLCSRTLIRDLNWS